MSISFTQSIPVGVPKIGRNDPCPCGSGKKYKKCHLRAEDDMPIDRNPQADGEFDNLCESYGIPLDTKALIQWNRTRGAKDFNLSYFIELFAAYAPGNDELHALLNLLMQVLKNHPGKPDPSIKPDDPGRFRSESFDVPDIDPSHPFGRVNKALALTKIRDWLKALDGYATVLPHISEFDEAFRVYLNIGVCLMNCGQTELARAYFTKSIAIKPSYDIAHNNLKTLNNQQLVAQQTIIGYGILLTRIIEQSPTVTLTDPSDSELITDVNSFLNSIQKERITVTQKQRVLTLSSAKYINSKLLQPDPDRQTIRANRKTLTFDAKSQWQYPKLSFIYILCLQMGLLRFENNRLKLSRLGKQFSGESDTDRFTQIFKDWITEVDWSTFSPPGWVHEMDEELLETTQSFVPAVLAAFAKMDKPMRSDELTKLVQQPGMQTKQLSNEEKAQNAVLDMMLASRIERHILEPLVWMGILTASKKFGLFSRDRTFTLTTFGKNLCNELMEKADALIPKIMREHMS